jgi:hypothetical protein
MNPDDLTIALAQREQPWTVPYGRDKWWVVNNEGRLKHCLAHARSPETTERRIDIDYEQSILYFSCLPKMRKYV